MSGDWDGIILGTGPNSLVLQALPRVAACGSEPGPGDGARRRLATVEEPALPGFWHNTHSFFHRASR
jgi:hypothetical protein